MEEVILFNTGAIGRTCVATDTALDLIYQLGFIINDKYVKRAGMDYWPRLKLQEYLDYDDFLHRNAGIEYGGETETGSPKLWFATTKARQCYTDVRYGQDDYIMFGKESAGIPEEILAAHPSSCVRIPMYGDIRLLNLSNTRYVMMIDMMGTWLIGVPLALLTGLYFRLPIVWVYFIFSQEELVRLIVSVFIFRGRKWMHTLQ